MIQNALFRMSGIVLSLGAAIALVCIFSGTAVAQTYSLPLIECDKSGGCYITAYYDLNRSSGVMRDWNCGSHTYDQHTGTDFGIGGFAGMDANSSRPIVAAAAGTVTAAVDGYFDRQTSASNSTCGTSSSCGNYVRVRHADGKVTIYCHMKRGSVAVANGATVSCGQVLGRVGSSGCSTGPHLHFGVNTASGASDCPYKATSGCGGSVSYWTTQNGYRGLPSYSCCVPNCSGKACGDNGCGGSCGTCTAANRVCQNNQCVCVANCSGKTCGDNGCGGSCGTCASNQTCQNNQCVCAPNCNGKACGDNGCGGSCGTCAGNQTCQNNQCVCVPDCQGKTCGDDGCGGSCGTCDRPMACQNGSCVCVPQCDGKDCGSDGCGGTCGTCPMGYGCDAAGICACIPDCGGKACGSDGCGGICGRCPEGETCKPDSTCTCTPDCKDKVCGSDGCGGECGTCGGKQQVCQNGKCVACTPNCRDKSCGDDGCGGSCGSCSDGYCVEGKCAMSCTPNCERKSCGDDGCGGICGICEGDDVCYNGACLDESLVGVDPDVELLETGCSCSVRRSSSVPFSPLALVLVCLALLAVRLTRREV